MKKSKSKDQSTVAEVFDFSSGPLCGHQRNAIQLAFRWSPDSGQALYFGWCQPVLQLSLPDSSLHCMTACMHKR